MRESHLKAQPSPAAPLVCEHKQTYYAIKQMFTVKKYGALLGRMQMHVKNQSEAL